MQNYATLIKIFQENEINELGVLPFPINQRDLPQSSQKYHPFAVIESNLGIPKTALIETIKEAHEIYVTLSKSDIKEMEQVTRFMIMLKPDNYTAMNRRKELMVSGYIDPVNELKLLSLIFTIPKHAKSSIAWYHRQWIVAQYNTIDIQAEFRLCERACSSYKRNYYAWSYRYWILSRHQDDSALIEAQYRYILDWIVRNISDYSGFQYLEQVIKIRKWNKLEVERHMTWLDDLIIKFPGHESIWCHKRYCSHMFFDLYKGNSHQFIQNILQDKYKDQALGDLEEDFILQKQLAMKCGLWIMLLENRHDQGLNPLLIDRYRSVIPVPEFLDRQG